MSVLRITVVNSEGLLFILLSLMGLGIPDSAAAINRLKMKKY